MLARNVSYITFDYKCPECGTVDSRLVRRSDMMIQFCTEHTDVSMLRLPPGTRTTFRFADKKLKE